MAMYDTGVYTISNQMDSIIDKINDTSNWPRTEYTISDKGLTVKTPMVGYHNSNIYKSYEIPKYVFTEAIKAYLPELIQTDPDIRNMISSVIKKEIRKTR
jgi:hypothetical protein